MQETLSNRLDAVSIELDAARSVFGALSTALSEFDAVEKARKQLNDAIESLMTLSRELAGVRLDPVEGEFPTPRQALALGRALNQAMRDERFAARPHDAYASVSRARIGVGGVSENYLGVRFADGYECGVDRDGGVSS